MNGFWFVPICNHIRGAICLYCSVKIDVIISSLTLDAININILEALTYFLNSISNL